MPKLQRTTAELLSVVEDLHPDLAACIDESGSFGRSIRHPLVIDIMYAEPMNAMLNERYLHKKKAVDEARADGDQDQFIWLHERPFRLQALLECLSDFAGYYDADGLTDEECELVEQVWVDAEGPSVNRDIWIELFESVPCPALNDLPPELTIYRGTVPEDEDGISWTLDKKRAQFFANRFNHDRGVVKSRTIARADALFFTDARGEREIIFDSTEVTS